MPGKASSKQQLFSQLRTPRPGKSFHDKNNPENTAQRRGLVCPHQYFRPTLDSCVTSQQSLVTVRMELEAVQTSVSVGEAHCRTAHCTGAHHLCSSLQTECRLR